MVIDVNKGEVLQNTTVSHTIRIDKEVRKVRPLCNCISYKVKDNQYKFWFTTKKVPNGVEQYNTKKSIVIEYHDDDQLIITISARVVKQLSNEQ